MYLLDLMAQMKPHILLPLEIAMLAALSLPPLLLLI